jgi:iron complex transport system substrate-binding protein
MDRVIAQNKKHACLAFTFYAFVFLTITLSANARERPVRIVSLSLCTDQLLMMLVDHRRIAALSFLARRPESSVMAAAAKKLPFTYGNAEDVIRHRPDLVIASTYATRATIHLLRRLGRKIVTIAPADDFEDIADNIRLIARATGESKRGEQLISDMQQALRKLVNEKTVHKPTAALIFANSYTSGSGTLADQIVHAGGLANHGRRLGVSGTAKISLESLLVQQPDALILGRRDFGGHDRANEVFHHPTLLRLLAQIPSMTLADKYWICGTPHTLKGVERVRNFRNSIITPRSAK